MARSLPRIGASCSWEAHGRDDLGDFGLSSYGRDGDEPGDGVGMPGDDGLAALDPPEQVREMGLGLIRTVGCHESILLCTGLGQFNGILTSS
jgi:hypothetical protein